MGIANIRSANLRDSKAVSDLMLELGYSASPELIYRKLREFSERDYDEVFIAELDEEVVGVIS